MGGKGGATLCILSGWKVLPSCNLPYQHALNNPTRHMVHMVPNIVVSMCFYKSQHVLIGTFLHEWPQDVRALPALCGTE